MVPDVSKGKQKADKLHWTEHGTLCENRGMSQEGQRPNRSIVNWLGLGALVLMVVGLIRLSGGNRPPAELPQPSPSLPLAGEMTSPTAPASPELVGLTPSPTRQTPPASDLDSPLPASLTSPLSADLSSPLPSPVVSLPPTPTSPVQVDGFYLTVLHTNDTWGYLLPCG